MNLDEEMEFNGETRFTPGQEVIAARSLWPRLTEGKTYTVLEFIEPVRVDGFRFPAYVMVASDNGKRIICHTYRFRPVDRPQHTQENPMNMAQINRDEFLTTKAVAALLGCSLRAVQRYCDQGSLPYQLTIGGHRRIRRSAVEQVVAELTRAGRPPAKTEPSPQRGVLVGAMVTKLGLMETINRWRKENNLSPLQHDDEGNPRFACDVSIVQSFHDGLRCALGLLIAFEQ